MFRVNKYKSKYKNRPERTSISDGLHSENRCKIKIFLLLVENSLKNVRKNKN